MLKNKKGFSLVELIVVIAILAVFAAVLIPSLLQYTENSRAQKDESAMDEVVNAVQLAMADQDCYDEMLQYSCTNNFITYSDSSGIYGQVIADGEFWAPDGSGRATTITFNPEIGPNGDTIYNLEKALVNDMTYGNGSVAQDRVMEGALIEKNQCYFKNASINDNTTGYTYNRVRQTVGDSIISTSATYRNSSFTIFIRFTQKDSVTVAEVNGQFNGTNLYEGAVSSKGSGTFTYDNNGDEITTVTTPGITKSEYQSTDLIGGGEFYPEYSNEGGIVPSGGQYITKDGTVLEEGKKIEMRPQVGDIYKDTYYEYRYGQHVDWEYDMHFESYLTWVNSSHAGWGVRVLNDALHEYGDMLSEINGVDVDYLNHTFDECQNLIKAPKISTNATSMVATFRDCHALSDLSQLQIPNSVTDVSMTFQFCPLITTTPRLPDHLTDLPHTFWGCTNLTTITNMPSKLTSMSGSFYDCKSLVTAPVIPEGVTNLTNTFYGCSALVNLPKIPESVVEMQSTFAYCTSITDDLMPVIPESVKKMGATFAGCTGLVNLGDFKIPESVTHITSLFSHCSNLVVAPKLPSGVTNMNNVFYYCESLLYAPTIPQNTTSMEYTFMGCSSLIKAPKIPSDVRDMYSTFRECSSLIDISELVLPSGLPDLTCTFMDCTALQTAPVIPNSVSRMSHTFSGCTALKIAPIIPENVNSLIQCFMNCRSLTGNVTILTNKITKLTSSGYNSAYRCLYGTNLPITVIGNGSNMTSVNTIVQSANNGNAKAQ